MGNDLTLYARDRCSNRTFMELKLVVVLENRLGDACSNRTFMELKWRTRRRYLLPVPF